MLIVNFAWNKNLIDFYFEIHIPILIFAKEYYKNLLNCYKDLFYKPSI